MLVAFRGALSHCSAVADWPRNASGSRTNILRSTTVCITGQDPENIWNRRPLWPCTTRYAPQRRWHEKAVFAGTVGAWVLSGLETPMISVRPSGPKHRRSCFPPTGGGRGWPQ